ncbi:MAG: ABC transporter substrate-binding protein [Myxococcota bacterium]|jgi:phospholipid transport system substrate-binding protein|nr:ABC transporter substrate-binding protein [Myxococcota bacterium]
MTRNTGSLFDRFATLGAAAALALSFVAAPALAADPARIQATGDEATAEARTAVRSLVDRVLGELSKQGVDDDTKIKSLEKIVFGEFDFGTISRLVLARNFKKFNKEQQKDFENEFKVYLSRSYGKRLLRYANEKVDFRKARVEKRGDVTVMTMIIGGAADGIDMNYRMRNRSRGWKVIDVVIEGISLISNFRTQFKEIISRDGPEGLLKRLRDKRFVAEEHEGEAA